MLPTTSITVAVEMLDVHINIHTPSNEKDRIYAVLGLPTGAYYFNFIKADYGKCFEEVFATTAAFFCLRAREIHSLYYSVESFFSVFEILLRRP